MAASPLGMPSCAVSGCNTPGVMRCPVCVSQGRPDFFVCNQNHFEAMWGQHKILHDLPLSSGAVEGNTADYEPGTTASPPLTGSTQDSARDGPGWSTGGEGSSTQEGGAPADEDELLFGSLADKRYGWQQQPTTSSSSSSQAQQGSGDSSEPVCSVAGCNRPGDFLCPTCKDLNLPPFYVCSNEHLVQAWPSHSGVHAQASVGTMQIVVQPVDKPQFSVSVPLDSTVQVLKETVKAFQQIPTDRQRLIQAGRILENPNERLSTLGIGDGTVVQLAVRALASLGQAGPAAPITKDQHQAHLRSNSGLPLAHPLPQGAAGSHARQALQQPPAQQSQPRLACPTCSTCLMYPGNATMIRCPRCQSIMAVPRGLQNLMSAGGPYPTQQLLLNQQLQLLRVQPAGTSNGVCHVTCAGCGARLGCSPQHHVIQCPMCNVQMRVGNPAPNSVYATFQQPGSQQQQQQQQQQQPQQPQQQGAGGVTGDQQQVLQSFLRTLHHGTEFLKFGRVGSPHKRRVRFNRLRDHLTWGSNAMRLIDLTHVDPGISSKIFQRSSNLKHADPSRSFTIYSRHRTLDLMADSQDQRDMWVAGMRALIADLAERQRMATRNHFLN